MIPIEHQKNILKVFLDIFYTNLTKEDIQKFKVAYPKIKNIYYQNTSNNLKKLGCYLMLLSEDKHPKIYNAYDLFNNYIGRNIEDKSWLDLTTGIIFLYYPAHTESNKKTNEILKHLISHRHFKNLITIFLTEIPIFEIKEVYDSINGIVKSSINKVNINEEATFISKPKTKSTDTSLQTKPKMKAQNKDPFI